jgi:MerR family transcriptional regulator, light-induced transcriptional regulator
MAEFSTRLRELRARRKLRQKDLGEKLGVAQTTVANYEQGSRFPGEEMLERIADFFDVSLDYLLGRSGSSSPEESDYDPLSPLARRYLDTLLAGSREEAGRLVLRALQRGDSLQAVYREVFERTLQEVGLLWAEGKLSVAAEHHFSLATQQIMSQLYPRLLETRKSARELTCVCLAVSGEQHEIGARIVADFLELEGWRTYFLGSNLSFEDILQAVRERRPDVLALSATMPHNAESVVRVIRLIRESPQLRSVRILVGGQAFNLDSGRWERTGADGYAANAEEAVKAAGRIVNERRAAR